MAVDAAAPEEAAQAGAPVTAGVSTLPRPLPFHAVLCTRTALNFPCRVHLTSRWAVVWGITPPNGQAALISVALLGPPPVVRLSPQRRSRVWHSRFVR
jgi:hypothetical protein